MLTQKGEIVSLPDYYRKAMTANKKINSLYTEGAYCYVSTGFGVLKINVGRAEISDTYNLGFNVDYTYIEAIIFMLQAANEDSTEPCFPTTCWIETIGKEQATSLRKAKPLRPN